VTSGAVGQPSLLRALNLRATFDLVSSEGPIAATRIVQATGLSKPTVSEVVRDLLEVGLITKVGRTTGQVGPSAQLYDVNPQCGWVLGVDVGHEFVRVVAADLSGKVIARADERASRRGAMQMVEQIDKLVAQVGDEAGSAPRYLAVVGTPGVLRPGAAHLSLAPMLSGWERPAVLQALRERLAEPLVVENDVNLAAIGEMARGAGRGVRDFVLISIGTGLGMGVVLNGKLHRGASGLAGEVGYLPVDLLDKVDGRRDHIADWHRGAFEPLLTSAAVVALARSAGMGSVSSAAAVIDAARTGDTAARGVVAILAARLAHLVAAVAAVLDPELIVLGGGIGTGAVQLLIEPTLRTLETITPFRPHIAASELGSAAVLDGAICEGLRLAREQIFSPDGSPMGRLSA
jgi:predicted NBD/HSP70 family sugar kinase